MKYLDLVPLQPEYYVWSGAALLKNFSILREIILKGICECINLGEYESGYWFSHATMEQALADVGYPVPRTLIAKLLKAFSNNKDAWIGGKKYYLVEHLVEEAVRKYSGHTPIDGLQVVRQ